MGLKIGVVSKLSGFSPSGIRYFEERGIVSPSHGRDGTYRSFDFPDVARLLECRNYRECGCETPEIASLLASGSCADVDGALDACEEKLREHIEECMLLEAFLARRRRLVRLAMAGEPVLGVGVSPAAYWAPLWMPGEQADVEPRIPDEDDGYPIPFADSGLLFDKGAFAGEGPYGASVGYVVYRQHVRRPPALETSAFLPPARSLHAVVRVRPDFSPETADIEAVRSHLRAHDLRASGAAFTHRICTTYGPAEVRDDELWVPLAE